MSVKLTASVLVWLAALLPYLSSRHQQLLPEGKSVAKWLAWPLCTVLLAGAVYVMNLSLNSVSAFLTVFAMLMGQWIVLVLVSSHARGKLLLVSCSLLFVNTLIAMTGAGHAG